MANALIGFSGFVGSTLLKQADFESLYRSTNIADINGESFDTVVCAGAPAQKWIANQEPGADLQKIDSLIAHLSTVECKKFILISTVDVFKDSRGVDEDSIVDEAGLHAYGLHRRRLEKFVAGHFPNHLIVRLPGLVGSGLRKNVLFDLLNNNNLSAIESRNIFQFYPMVNLWYDIQIALDAGLQLIHLTSEPISVAEAFNQGFSKAFDQRLVREPVAYDMQTLHAAAFGALGKYQYNRREVILAIRAYAQTESVTIAQEMKP
ncbi:pyridine nucleotide transhydrogenase [Silvimonas sp.]|uniref:pyridine nucleotide transhydrogenase n=1 Tax=Silvimonas sp. TaxID=2650811 RepID=UPI00283D2275|nr:pyridine nucleotide transhydrogenase [Silvimonas sp.]MDR3429429.1 pyridine nucleotide transhydrogenase [Silvimonas sp.]